MKALEEQRCERLIEGEKEVRKKQRKINRNGAEERKKSITI